MCPVVKTLWCRCGGGCDVAAAVGCPDMKKPSNGWLRRSTNQMTAGCEASEVTWTLDCIGTEWQGTTFNCSLGPSATSLLTSRTRLSELEIT